MTYIFSGRMMTTGTVAFVNVLVVFSSFSTAVRGTVYCPVMDLNFADFGVDECSPSRTEFDMGSLFDDAECLGWQNWTMPPEIACSHPDMPNGTILEYPCQCNFGKKCKVLCKAGYEMIGRNNMITCRDNAQWTEIPKCIEMRCMTPVVDGGTVDSKCDLVDGAECMVTCNQDRRLQGPSTIKCSGKEIVGQIPECVRFCGPDRLAKQLIIKGRCFGNIDETCEVSCTNPKLSVIGSATVKCLSTGDWEQPFPLCGCLASKLPPYLKMIGSCSLVVSEECQASCLDEYYVHRAGKIKCETDGTWTVTIVCYKHCLTPKLPYNLAYEGKCDPHRVGYCAVRCTAEDEELPGTARGFSCEKDGTHTAIPVCVKKGMCSDSLPSRVEFISPCSYAKGVTCSIGCRDQWSLTIQGNKITCGEDQLWHPLPGCEKFCVQLNHPNSHQVPGTSCDRHVFQECTWQCDSGYSPESHFKIRCEESGRWSGLMECTKLCPNVNLANGIKFSGSCSRTAGSLCSLECEKSDHDPVPTGSMRCTQWSTWTTIPKCLMRCSLKELKDLTSWNDKKLSTNCTLPDIWHNGDSCSITCQSANAEPSHASPVLKCTDSGLQMEPKDLVCLPSCGEIKLKHPLEPVKKGSCDYLKPREYCLVQCADGSKLVGLNKVMCTPELTVPKCVPECPTPNVHSGSYVQGSCSLRVGSVCKVLCSDPKSLIEGKKEFLIKCFENFQWTESKPCVRSCGEANLDETVTLSLHEPCRYTKQSTCKVECLTKPGYRVIPNDNRMEITCQDNGEWTPSPTCMIQCPPAHIPPYIRFTQDCNQRVGESCLVSCIPGSVMQLPLITRVFCDEKTGWSAFPRCTPNHR